MSPTCVADLALTVEEPAGEPAGAARVVTDPVGPRRTDRLDRHAAPCAADHPGEETPPQPLAFLAHSLVATTAVAVLPTALIWWLCASGRVHFYPLCLALGLFCSLSAGYAGSLFWQRRPASRDMVFGDLMIWRFALRLWREAKLRSAEETLGLTSREQLRLADGLTPQRQVRLFEELASALDARDSSTYGHSRRVAHCSWVIAKRMGLPAEEVARVRAAAAMHDIGKIHTPRAVLRKPGRLTEEEFEVIRRHPADGARMVRVLRDRRISEIVRSHHERLDGTGYPEGLCGEEIPLGARIVAVADTFDAMTASRPYRSARVHREALAVLLAEAGTKLDAGVVRAFCKHYSGRRTIALWSSLTTLPTRFLDLFSPAAAGLAPAASSAAVVTLLGGAALAAGHLAPTPSARMAAHRPAQAVAAAAARTRGLADDGSDVSGVRPRSGRAQRRTRTHPSMLTRHTRATTTGTGLGAPARAAAAAALQSPSGSPSRESAPASGGSSSSTAAATSVPGASTAVKAAGTSASNVSTAGVAAATTVETEKRGSEALVTPTEAVKDVVGETTSKVQESATHLQETVGQATEKTTTVVEDVGSKTTETLKTLTGEATRKITAGL